MMLGIERDTNSSLLGDGLMRDPSTPVPQVPPALAMANVTFLRAQHEFIKFITLAHIAVWLCGIT